MSPRAEWVEMGRIGAPFGVKGWMHVESYTDPPGELLKYVAWSLKGAGEERTERQVIEGRAQGKGLVVRLAGVGDRDAAAALRGSVVEIARANLPATGARQFYRADLVGLAVRNLDGAELGVLEHFVDGPAHAVMVVRGARGEHWVPATPVHIREVRLDAGVIVVDWPVELEDPG
ncbi:MAG: ribosome maturation factor RimM [Gammaproteobacteria bacterium]